MDERTRRTDKELAPGARRLIPEPFKPWVKAPPRSRWRIGIGVVVLVLLGFAIFETVHWVRTATPPGGRFPQGALQTVGAATAALGDVRVVLNELGTVTPLATVTVKTQIAGQLLQIGFTESQIVHKGDFLAQIDPRPYQALLEQYQGQLAKDQAVLKQAQVDLVRYQTLVKQDSIARQKADDQVYLVQQDEGAIRINGIDDVLVRYAKCCNALPGDDILGFITRGRGVTIHRRGCQKAFDTDPERRVEITWDSKARINRSVQLRVVTANAPLLRASAIRRLPSSA